VKFRLEQALCWQMLMLSSVPASCESWICHSHPASGHALALSRGCQGSTMWHRVMLYWLLIIGGVWFSNAFRRSDDQSLTLILRSRPLGRCCPCKGREQSVNHGSSIHILGEHSWHHAVWQCFSDVLIFHKTQATR